MRLIRQLSLSAILVSLLCLPAHATPAAVNDYLDNPQLVGKARLKVLLWNVFDASLYADSGHYDSAAPFALSLNYLRALEGKQIVAKSMEEIKNQQPDTSKEQLALWERDLLRMIPDVSNGTTITGVRTNDSFTSFYLNDTKLGSINDVAFTQAFFGIWLGEKTSNPKFRHKLLGKYRTT